MSTRPQTRTSTVTEQRPGDLIATQPTVRPTTILIERRDGRHRATLASGLLRPQLVRSRPDCCRVGLLATTALLLGGDAVHLEVEVGAGARLDLFDVAGTVAHHGRGRPASWHVRIVLGEGARLTMSGEPFVVADGAEVRRSMTLEMAGSAAARVRETVVLGRTGELGGLLTSVTRVSVAGAAVLVEEQHLDPGGLRTLPGLLGELRVLDSLLRVGPPLPGSTAPGSTASGSTASDPAPPGSTASGPALPGPALPGPVASGALAPPGLLPTGSQSYRLPREAGTLDRFLGRELADSPLHARWATLLGG